jgi:hypothetical protein
MGTLLTQISCPNCKSPIQAHVDQLIDVDHEPGTKARLLSGSLNSVRCPACGYEGQLATPLVYHDPEKELLLNFIPVEISMPKDEQERIIGKLINQAIERLPPESRKAYLFQPQAVLTMQSLIERVLEADGITKEDLDAQREKLLLFEQLMKASPDSLDKFVEEHDENLDSAFYQLASLSIQATDDEAARSAATQRFEASLSLSTYGKQIKAQEAEVQAAAESLRQLGESITLEKLLELFIQAPNQERATALANLTRPALDYAFFTQLTERIDKAEGEKKQELTGLRELLLEVTQRIDKIQEARVEQASALMRALLDAEDLDKALQSALTLVDEVFLGILQANIRAAQEKGDDASLLAKLEEIDQKLQSLIVQSLPQGLQLAKRVLEADSESEAIKRLEQFAQDIDENLLGSLIATAQRLEEEGDSKGAERLKHLHKQALKISMKSNLEAEG